MKLAVTLSCLLAITPIAAYAQGGPPEQRTEAEDEVGQSQPGESGARLTMQAFGKCAAERKPGEANRLLTMDFTRTGYRTGLQLLSEEAARNCARDSIGRGNVMRSANLLFAGALAEAMLEADTTPLNTRLARGAEVMVPSYSPTDTVAQCLARSLPDSVATLFATEPESDEEAVAAAPLLQIVSACANAAKIDARMEISIPALRAMIATASYRIVANSSVSGA